MVTPIRPSEVTKLKNRVIPDAVIETFNELIAKHCVDGHATVSQKEVVERLVERGLKRHEIFDNHWLDIEDIYKKAGWEVQYDKPGFNEDYEPTFTFVAKRK